jgi:imidazole glycerol-phosphate synthase subunit HisH
MKKKVCILNYGSGNIKSVFNMITHLGYDVEVSNQNEVINDASHLILPGVGSYVSSIKKIHQKINIDVLEANVLRKGKPFLGICVGMQVLSEYGFEFEKTKGLGWIPGETKRLDSKNQVLPHIGWNEIQIISDSKLTQDCNGKEFYFVHSFTNQNCSKRFEIAKAEYGTSFNAVLGRDNIFGVQFHPEKSQNSGIKLFKNFIDKIC